MAASIKSERTAAEPSLAWLVIGDVESPHFREIAAELRRDRCCEFRQIAAAEEQISNGECVPNAVLVYQGFPDEYRRSDVERLIGLVPLARWIVCFSAWCESQGRTEQLWPHGWCVPAKDVFPRIAQLRNEFVSDAPLLPATASRDEAFGRVAARFAQAKAVRSSRFLVRGDDRAFVELARDMLQEFGHKSVETVADAELLVLVIAIPQPSSFEEIDSLRRDLPDLEIMVVTDLATPGEIDRLRAVGVTEVVSTLRFSDGLWAVPTQCHSIGVSDH